jgi:hypothetical protein
MITRDPSLLEHVHLLSEGLFVNGLGYRNLLDRPAAVTPMLGRLEPFVFHGQLDGRACEQAKTDGADAHLVARRA